MRPRTLAHISDLHLGHDASAADRARALCESLRDAGVDHLVVTGDVTHRGHHRDYALFEDAFDPFVRSGRVTVVPGNHDRLGENCASQMMDGPRVQAERHPGLHLVRLDSTAPHNRSLITGHGVLVERDFAAVDAALDEAAPGALRCLLLHHHLMPLPEEDVFERVARWMGRPWAAEVAGGDALIERLRGRCDLVLHGHRHVPSEAHLEAAPRGLSVYNAGATLRLGRARLFTHCDGQLQRSPEWLETAPRIEPTWGEGAGRLEPAW